MEENLIKAGIREALLSVLDQGVGEGYQSVEKQRKCHHWTAQLDLVLNGKNLPEFSVNVNINSHDPGMVSVAIFDVANWKTLKNQSINWDKLEPNELYKVTDQIIDIVMEAETIRSQGGINGSGVMH